jgi:DNA repair protein RadC
MLKDIARDARPRERRLAQGPAALADAELIALLPRTGLWGVWVLRLAHNLLDPAHNHPFAAAEPLRAVELPTQAPKRALQLADVRGLDHMVVRCNQVAPCAEWGRL